MTTSLIDFILALFRDHAHAEAFVKDPQQALQSAGLSHVTPQQLHSVVSSAAPHLGLGSGDPVAGLQRAVSSHYNMGSGAGPAMAPHAAFTGAAEATLVSHSAALASPSVLSPDSGGGTVQQGAVNLGFGFGDVTLGNKVTAIGDGATATGGDHDGDISNQIVSGDGSALGDHNQLASGAGAVAGEGNQVAQGERAVIGDGNTQYGDVHGGPGTLVNQGSGQLHNSGDIVNAGGDANVGNEGPVLDHITMIGGNGGNAAGGDAEGGCDFLGGGANATGGAAIGGSGSGPAINITTDNSQHAGGNLSSVESHGGEMYGANASQDYSDHSFNDYSGQDNSTTNINDSYNQTGVPGGGGGGGGEEHGGTSGLGAAAGAAAGGALGGPFGALAGGAVGDTLEDWLS